MKRGFVRVTAPGRCGTRRGSIRSWNGFPCHIRPSGRQNSGLLPAGQASAAFPLAARPRHWAGLQVWQPSPNGGGGSLRSVVEQGNLEWTVRLRGDRLGGGCAGHGLLWSLPLSELGRRNFAAPRCLVIRHTVGRQASKPSARGRPPRPYSVCGGGAAPRDACRPTAAGAAIAVRSRFSREGSSFRRRRWRR